MHWIDPDYLPATLGVVGRFVPNPHGDLDGLVLIDETRRQVPVHFPPHLTERVTAAIKVGDKICVRGVRPRGIASITAVALVAAYGHTVVDNGPVDGSKHKTREKDAGRIDKEIIGSVRLVLYSPKGEPRGALLEDGTVLRVSSKEAKRFAALWSPGAAVVARGKCLRTADGTVVEAFEIGATLAALQPVRMKKRDHRDKDRDQRGGEKSNPLQAPAVLVAANS
jgi:hypothetical protein